MGNTIAQSNWFKEDIKQSIANAKSLKLEMERKHKMTAEIRNALEEIKDESIEHLPEDKELSIKKQTLDKELTVPWRQMQSLKRKLHVTAMELEIKLQEDTEDKILGAKSKLESKIDELRKTNSDDQIEVLKLLAKDEIKNIEKEKEEMKQEIKNLKI